MDTIDKVKSRNELADFLDIPRKKLSYILYIKGVDDLYTSFECNGFFNLTRIGDFSLTLDGYFNPTLIIQNHPGSLRVGVIHYNSHAIFDRLEFFTPRCQLCKLFIGHIFALPVLCNQRIQTEGFAEQNGRDAERAD